jgi:hypothetical protein
VCSADGFALRPLAKMYGIEVGGLAHWSCAEAGDHVATEHQLPIRTRAGQREMAGASGGGRIRTCEG